MAISINPRYKYGDILYLKNDPDQCPLIVVGYNIVPDGWKYILEWPDGNQDKYYSFQVGDEPAEFNHLKDDD